MDFYEAAKSFTMNIEKLVEESNFKREELEECPECGESPIAGGCIISPCRNSCATFHCGKCGSVVDKWAEEVVRQ